MWYKTILPRGEISNSRTKSRFLTLLLMYIDFVWYKSQLYEYKSHKLSIYEYKSHFGSGFLWYKSYLQYKLTFLRCNDVFKQYKRDVSRYKTAFFVIIAWSASRANLRDYFKRIYSFLLIFTRLLVFFVHYFHVFFWKRRDRLSPGLPGDPGETVSPGSPGVSRVSPGLPGLPGSPFRVSEWKFSAKRRPGETRGLPGRPGKVGYSMRVYYTT